MVSKYSSTIKAQQLPRFWRQLFIDISPRNGPSTINEMYFCLCDLRLFTQECRLPASLSASGVELRSKESASNFSVTVQELYRN